MDMWERGCLMPIIMLTTKGHLLLLLSQKDSIPSLRGSLGDRSCLSHLGKDMLLLKDPMGTYIVVLFATTLDHLGS